MRLYFDLSDGEHTLPDVYGIEVPDLDEARRVAIHLIQKTRRENPSAAEEWSGWRIIAVDTAGTVVFSIDLDSVT